MGIRNLATKLPEDVPITDLMDARISGLDPVR